MGSQFDFTENFVYKLFNVVYCVLQKYLLSHAIDYYRLRATSLVF